MKEIRLDKFLADRIGLSRKEAREIISKGNILYNNSTISDYSKKVSKSDVITYNNTVIEYGDEFYYYMFNKPSGYLTAKEDRFNKTIFDILPTSFKKLGIMPVGRLDNDTTGLLILTNNGRLAYRMLLPSNEIVKSYIATVSKKLSQQDLKVFSEGIDLGDFITKPATIKEISTLKYNVCISEGKYHQVKRMFEKFDSNVVDLTRIQFGPIKLDIEIGEYRKLNESEVQEIFNACRMKKDNYE